jgi:hypothetical protein
VNKTTASFDENLPIAFLKSSKPAAKKAAKKSLASQLQKKAAPSC